MLNASVFDGSLKLTKVVWGRCLDGSLSETSRLFQTHLENFFGLFLSIRKKVGIPEGFKPFVIALVKSEWQSLWDNVPNTNKLKTIRPSIKAWQTSDQNKRFQEVILSRLRIGHKISYSPKLTLLSVSVATGSPSTTKCLAAYMTKFAPPSNPLHPWMTVLKASIPSFSISSASTSTT
ncbi:hypothetical protein M8J77_019341 [Diaphorina citri]|nr:hypothetical protein M8J77_019341 [Diaphorina citri]